MAQDPRTLLIRPVISERSYDMIGLNRYTFEVAKDATKVEIAKAIQEIFDVHVVKVNTMHVSGKMKRVRYRAGLTRSWKKAIVTLAPGESIEIFSV